MAIHAKKELLGRVLLNRGLITGEQLSASLAKQKQSGERLGDILVGNGWITEKDLSIGISRQLAIPYVDAYSIEPSAEVLEIIPLSVAERLDILPIGIEEDCINIAISEPLNLLALDEIRMFTGLEVNTMISTVTGIRDAIKQAYETTDSIGTFFDSQKSFKIGEILVTSGLLSERQLKIVLEEQEKTRERFGDVILKFGFINELQLTDAIARQLHIPMILLSSHDPSHEALSLVPRMLAEKCNILPVSLLPGGVLKIAISEPLSSDAVSELRKTVDREIDFAMALPSAVKREIPRFYRIIEKSGHIDDDTIKASKGALLGDILMYNGAITRRQLNESLEEQKVSNMRVGDILVKNGIITENQLAQAISTQLDIPVISFDEILPSKEALDLVPRDIALRLEILPVALEDNVLKIAIAEPLNLLAIDELKDFTGRFIDLMVSPPSQIRFKIEQFYSGKSTDGKITI